MLNKIFCSDPKKDRLVCKRTYNLLMTMKRLGIEFNLPLREILQPMSMDGIMLDKFVQAFIRCDNDK